MYDTIVIQFIVRTHLGTKLNPLLTKSCRNFAPRRFFEPMDVRCAKEKRQDR